MAGFSFLQTAVSLLVVLLIALSVADQPIVTTSCTVITLEPSGPPSTFTTLPRTSEQTTQEAPSQAPTPYEPEPEPEPSFTVASEPEETKQPPGPHHVTMSLPLPDLPPPVSTPPAQPPPDAQQPPPTPYPIPASTTLPPSTTWRYDPNYYPPNPRPTPKPCNELNDIAFSNYQHTQSLCQQAATMLPKEVQRLIASEKGHDFRRYCKVSPPTRCCDSVWEMWNAKRCFTWWPSKDSEEYYEPPFWKDGGGIWQ